MLGGVRTIVTNKVHFATAERTRGARPGKAQRTGAPCAIIADEVAADPGGAFVHTLRIVMREDAGQLLSTRDGHTPSCSEERCAPRRHRPCFPHRKARYSEQMRTVTVAMLLVACGGNQLASNNPPPAESPRIGEACRVFPADNPWNTDISSAPLDARSDAWVASIGRNTPFHPDFGSVYGIPYTTADTSTPLVPVTFDYADESDPGPYPIPANAPIEQGSDAHVLIVDTSTCMLYEMYAAQLGSNAWHAGSGAIFNLNSDALRPAGWTSADAAGLPIFPGLARYEEVAAGEIGHALRFTAAQTQAGYVYPARHFASQNTDPNVPPMGARARLKASVDISGMTPQAQVVARAMQRYGIILADNGSNWYVTGAPDLRWSDDDLDALKKLQGGDFEFVQAGPVTGP